MLTLTLTRLVDFLVWTAVYLGVIIGISTITYPLLQEPPPETPTETEWALDEENWARYVSEPGFIEYPLWDKTRVDYLGQTTAWEIDWAPKWAEAIGQSLYYAQLTERKPGIIILTTDRKADARHIYRVQTVAARHGIRIKIEDVE